MFYGTRQQWEGIARVTQLGELTEIVGFETGTREAGNGIQVGQEPTRC
jgi:hypothetical protein